MKNILLIILFFSSFIHSEVSADVFKCNLSGKISYQSIPCNGEIKKNQQKTIIIKKEIKHNQCLASCTTADMICRSNLKNGNYNSDGGFKVCQLKFLSCKATCLKTENARILRSEYRYARREYRLKKDNVKAEKRYDKIDKKYDKRMARIDAKEKKRCIRKRKDKINQKYRWIVDPSWDDRRRHRRALEAVAGDC